MSLKPCERRLLAMSVSTAWKVACDSTIVPGDMFGRIGLPGSSVTIGATSALPSARAIDSPVAFSTLLCLPVVRYGPFSSMPPVRISAVVLPRLDQIAHLEHRQVLDPHAVVHVDRPRHVGDVDARRGVDRRRPPRARGLAGASRRRSLRHGRGGREERYK